MLYVLSQNINAELYARKTRIAIEYAHKYVEKYPRAKVLWVNARTAEQLEYAYKTIGTELSIQGIKDPKKNILDVVNLYLSQGNHGQWLMVLDGADDEDTFLKKRATSSKQDSSGKQKQKTLLDYVPKCRSGSVLITSRSFSLACEMVNKQGDDTLEIPTFTTEESISLLRKTLSEDVCDNKGACTLVEVLHRSPMAISQATAYILARGKEITIPDYLASLKSRTLQASDENGNAVKANELYSAESAAVGACQILYDFIRQKYPEAGRLLAVISILDLQSIPAFLLDKNADDTKLVETAISILDQFGMITSFADQTFVGTIRLVQLSTKSWLAQKGEKTWASERALWLLTSAFPSADYEDLYEMCDILYPYANLVLGLQPTSRMSRLDRATLLFNTAGYAKYLGKYDDARRSLEEAVKLREEELGKDDEQVQDTKKALEAVSEAKRQTEMGIQPAKEGASAGSGKQWSIWSSAIGRTSKWPKALTKVQNLLQLAQQSLDQEQHHEAEARSKEGLAECEKTLGQDHIDTLKMADCLAIAYQSQGRQDEALAAHIRVLEWCKTKYGLDHIDTLRQTYNLALTYDLQGQYDKATTMYLEALEGTKKLLGPDNPEALRIMCSLATVYDLQGHTTEAESTFREALAGQQARLGDSHPETLLTMHNLALCAQSHNDLATSEQYLLRALEGQDLVLGPEHSATLRTASNLALNFQLMHKYEQAEPLFLLALEGQAKRLGEEHPDTLFTRHMLGEFYEELGRTGEAEVQYRLALEGRERRLGQQHHDTLLTKRRLEALGGRLDVAKAPINDVVQLH
jgi:tetratricopeptide (TPR) repeat protein